MLEMGHTLLVSDRGYAVFGADGEVRIVAAYDEQARVRRCCAAALARLDHATVMWLTASQQWAIRTCVEARLDLRSQPGRRLHRRRRGAVHPVHPERRLPVTDLDFRCANNRHN